jgi:L-2-hydroxycarboxylate dehydrogenase (NAD+)
MKIAITDLRQKVIETLSVNFDNAQAAEIADILLWSEMSGYTTMGIVKLTGTEPLQNIKPQHPPKIERDTKLSQLINAGANPAPLVSRQATEVTINKAKEHGFGLVGVHNFFSSNLTQAYYVEKIAEHDLIGIVCTSQPSSVAAFGGIDPVLGTNPIGFSFPTNEEPLVFDMATSALTWYGLVLAKARGEKLPDNIAIDKNGELTTDPSDAMAGALLPFDRSYKGAGIGLVIEALAGPLVGAAYASLEGEWGALFIAIDPDLLVDVITFKIEMSDLVQKIKASRKQGNQEIRLPGERARQAFQQAKKSGFVDVDEVVLKELGYQ